MQVLIDVDLPGFPMEEFEPIAFRRPSLGELIWSEVEKKWELAGNGHLPYPWLILHRRFQWNVACPWLKCRYLTWNGSGKAFGWFVMPEMSDRGWVTTCDGGSDMGYELWSQCIDLPFPGGDWTTRVEENPNWGK